MSAVAVAPPKSAVVVGAGMVGLATAWHLQEHGVEVTVLDKAGVASGSSWGNAGWLTPGMAMPLSDPSVWSYGPKALLDPNAPLHVPFRVDPKLWNFLLRFVSRGTQRAWDRTMAALTPIDRIALESFDQLGTGGVESLTHEGPFIIGFEHERESHAFIHELENVARHGQTVPLHRLDDPRSLAPQLSDRVSTVFALEGQRFIEPGPYVAALGRAVVARGARIESAASVTSVTPQPGGGVVVGIDGGETVQADVAVLATGAWLPKLARAFGVRTLIQAGRGYSFSVPTEQPTKHPVYFPVQRVACTPYEGRFRIAGTMEFRRPDEPFQPRRVEAILSAVRPLFTGMDLDDRQDEWVGSRPVTPDGLPVIGRTKAPGVYVAGGHGMWGIVLGPATGRLLAQQIVTGEVPPELRPFDPLR
ncbi:NAD(P)/FAD-dependent oxidoreductase [Parafrigoribacterium soli]|uniref:NAD(P)/FAD-dependent oxidoreductase n=1 Tax=Parafrigoribacterium soli TaxID=3144663 RepID=UPI0032EF8928